jgi:hypothetical protein
MIRGAENGVAITLLLYSGQPEGVIVGKRKLGRHIYYTAEITNPNGTHFSVGDKTNCRPHWLNRRKHNGQKRSKLLGLW